MSEANQLRDQLISAGVRNLQKYGYPSVDKDNILTDEIYSAFFRSMLEHSPLQCAARLLDEMAAARKI